MKKLRTWKLERYWPEGWKVWVRWLGSRIEAEAKLKRDAQRWPARYRLTNDRGVVVCHAGTVAG